MGQGGRTLFDPRCELLARRLLSILNPLRSSRRLVLRGQQESVLFEQRTHSSGIAQFRNSGRIDSRARSQTVLFRFPPALRQLRRNARDSGTTARTSRSVVKHAGCLTRLLKSRRTLLLLLFFSFSSACPLPAPAAFHMESIVFPFCP